MSGELAKLLADLKETESLEFVRNSLAGGTDPMVLLAQAKDGMNVVGQRFAREDYYIPDLIFSGEILKGIVKILEPHLKQEKKDERLGKVVVGTVAGDIHNIGKDLVVFMLEVHGFEVLDLGIDVSPRKFVDAIQQSGSTVVGLSGFLTLAFDAMKDTVETIRGAGLRDRVKIMIGGGQIDNQVKGYVGADAYGSNAMDAVKLVQSWIGG